MIRDVKGSRRRPAEHGVEGSPSRQDVGCEISKNRHVVPRQEQVRDKEAVGEEWH